MKIKLKNLKYRYRGQERDLTFGDKTLISGRNGSGKTTAMSALLILVSGYDTDDVSNNNLFDNIKPNNPEEPKTAYWEGLFEIDGEREIKLRREASQNWIRPKSKNEYRRGNDQYKYFIDDLEVSAGDYNNTIENMFGKGEKVRLMLNTDFWRILTERALRNHLMTIVGEINDKEFKNADYTPILPSIHATEPDGCKKEVDPNDVRKSFMKRVKELTDAKKELDVKIKDRANSLPDISQVPEWEKRIEELKAERESIDATLLGLAHANDEYVAKRKQEEDAILAKENELKKAEYAYNDTYEKKWRELKSKLDDALANNRNLDTTEANLKRQIEDCESRIKTLEILRQEKLNELKGVMNRKFEGVCSHCGANLEGENYTDALAKFTAKKKADEQIVLTQGQKIKHDLDVEKERLPELKSQLEALQRIDTKPIREEISTLENNHIPWYNTEQCKTLQAEIETLKANRTQMQPNPDIEKGQIRKGEIDTELSELLGAVAVKKQREKAESELAELEARLKQTVAAKTENEKMQMLVEEYIKEQSEVIRVRANKLFERVAVEMTEENKSGDIVPCCKFRINGVVDTNNTASRTRIGYEVSRAFQKFYDRTLPMFFDRAESLNVENVPNHEGQVVLLKVTEGEFEVSDLTDVEDELAMRRPG